MIFQLYAAIDFGPNINLKNANYIKLLMYLKKNEEREWKSMGTWVDSAAPANEFTKLIKDSFRTELSTEHVINLKLG